MNRALLLAFVAALVLAPVALAADGSPSAGGAQGMLWGALAGLISIGGTQLVKVGMDEAGAKIPPRFVPLVSVGVGLGVSLLNNWFGTKGLPTIQVDPATAALMAGGSAQVIYHTAKPTPPCEPEPKHASAGGDD